MKKIVSLFRNRSFLRKFAVVTLVILVCLGSLFYERSSRRVFIDDSQILGPVVAISPSTAGKLEELDVYEGEKVHKGDLLAIVGTEALRAGSYGLVISAPNITGSSVNPQTTIVQLVNLIDMRVVGTVDENKGLNEVKSGQVVSFTVDALPGITFWGYVDEISPSAKQTSLSFSISSERPVQQFQVYARFDANKYPEIKNGMSAKMVVYTDTAD